MEGVGVGVAIKLDENLSRHLSEPLRALGHDVHHVVDEGLLSQPDPVIAAAARNENRILFTLDIGFADLRRHPPGAHPGMVVFRPDGMGPDSTRQLITSFVSHANLDELRGCVVIVEPGRVRVRRPDTHTS